MAKYENEGYCPGAGPGLFYSHPEVLNQKQRLIGLWSLFGSTVVCQDIDERGCHLDTQAVHEMLTVDPMAEVIMTAIVKYNSGAEKVLIKQDHTDGCLNMQSQGMILKRLIELNSQNPQLIVAAASNFAAILCHGKEDPNTTEVWFWDLENCLE